MFKMYWSEEEMLLPWQQWDIRSLSWCKKCSKIQIGILVPTKGTVGSGCFWVKKTPYPYPRIYKCVIFRLTHLLLKLEMANPNLFISGGFMWAGRFGSSRGGNGSDSGQVEASSGQKTSSPYPPISETDWIQVELFLTHI